MDLARAQGRLAAGQMPLEQIQESKLLIKCFVSYCREQTRRDVESNAQHIKLLFMMLSILSEHTLINYTFLKDFYLNEVALVYTAQREAACLAFFLTSSSSPPRRRRQGAGAAAHRAADARRLLPEGRGQEVLGAPEPNPNEP